MADVPDTALNAELLKAKLEAHKKDKLLHLIGGLFVGLLVGFFGANWMNTKPSVMPPAGQAAVDGASLPPDHPAVEGGGASSGAAMPEVQAKLKAADESPQDYDAQMEAAKMFFRINNFTKSAEYLERAAKIKPNDPETMQNLAVVYLRGGETEKALDYAEKAYQIQPGDYGSILILANLRFDTEKFAEAIPLYEKALALKPDDVNARTDLGTSYYKSGNLDKAIAVYKESLKRDPSHEYTLVNLVHVATAKGDVATAEDALSKLTAVNPQQAELAHMREDIDQLKKTGKIPTH